MDPNETLQYLLRSLECSDREDTIEALESLLDWVKHDGFMPKLVQSGCCGAYEVDYGD